MSKPLLLALVVVSYASAMPLEAQNVELRLRAFAGALDPDGGLGNAHILASATNVVSYEALPTLVTGGIGIDVRPGNLPALLRLGASHSFGRAEVGTWGCADMSGTPLPCPSILILVPTDVSSTQVFADAVLEAALGPALIRPIVGVALVRYGYEWDPEPVGSFSLEPGSHTDNAVALRYGAGIALPVGAAKIELEHMRHRTESGRLQPRRGGTTTGGVSIPLSALR